MHTGPGLQTLRADPSVQQRAQEAVEQARTAWLARPEIGHLRRDLARYGAGKALDELPALGELMRSREKAAALAEGLASAMCAVLSRQPFAQIPLRHNYSDRLALVHVLREARSILSLVLYEPGERQPAATACFGSGERHELCLAGQALTRLVSLGDADRGSRSVSIERGTMTPGERTSFDNARETKLVDSVARGGMVQLRLSRAIENPPPAREYRLSDGALVHQAAGDRGESRRELAMALLGRMERGDAVPAMQDLANRGPPHLRWQALRECLALDTCRGFASLCAIAADPADELSTAAASLRTQLVAVHPQLGSLEAARSPA